MDPLKADFFVSIVASVEALCRLHSRDYMSCPQGQVSTNTARLFSCLLAPPEEAQHRLVNRKQADLVKVAFYGLTDTNSMFREPEEDDAPNCQLGWS